MALYLKIMFETPVLRLITPFSLAETNARCAITYTLPRLREDSGFPPTGNGTMPTAPTKFAKLYTPIKYMRWELGEYNGACGCECEREVNRWRIVDTMVGSFSNHVPDGSLNLAIKMSSLFYLIERDAMYMFQSSCVYVLHKRSQKAIFHVEVVLVRQWIVPKGLLHVQNGCCAC